ncbi:serine/threonine protein kinase [Streptomyces profundus]|nr:serine/threonine protein kinase [Streptomyces sp. MA3_2.13]
MGRYRITARLGAGGMGRVYLGHSPGGRLVAVKVVRPELADDPGFRRRFVQEVKAARRVNGFFTAAVVDADPEGAPPWLATAYVPGLALDEAVAAHGPWPAASVRALGAGLAEALEAIHAARLVHRDLKPSNVLLASDGPRVVDFGISVAAEATALTRTGTVLGTPGFMAPEQLLDRPVTPATDVFALGAVLTHVATGTGPFGTGSAQSLNFRIAYEAPDLSRLPSPGLEFIARCLAKEPTQRPTVPALLDELALSAPESGAATAPWIPDAVARALPAAGSVPERPTATATAPDLPRQPAPAPAPSSPPSPSPAARREDGVGTVVGLGFALVAFAVAMVLPAVNGESVVTGPEGGWPFGLGALLNVATAVGLLAALRPGADRAGRRRARALHWASGGLATFLVVGLTVFFLVEDGALDDIGPGVWVYYVGCAATLFAAARFPVTPPPRPARPK